MRAVCVFCGSSNGVRPAYAEAARRVAEEISHRGLTLVYGGGDVGLMGILADAALESGGEVVGVMPKVLMQKELGHQGLTELHVVGSMHERKALMADLSDGFVALPGGYGTLEEFSEVLTWAQLGIHEKPCGLLDVDGFWDPLSGLFDRMQTEGFVRSEHRSLVFIEKDPKALLDMMNDYEPPATEKWLDRGDF